MTESTSGAARSDPAIRSRNGHLDFWKGVASIGVILVHVAFPVAFGKIMQSVGTCGVILFFLLSGYSIYSPGADKKAVCAKIMKRFRRNGRLTLIAVAIYFAFTCVEKLVAGGFGEWIAEFADPTVWLRMVFLGDFEIIGGDPLWFMPALLYGYLMFWLIYRFDLQKVLHILLPLLLLLRVGMETYTNSFGADWHLSGNALVGALPVMALGHFIAANKDRVMKISDVGVKLALCCSAVFMFLTAVFRVGNIDISQIFKIVCAVCVFIFALTHGEYNPSALLQRIGREDSLYIYLFHFLIIRLLRQCLQALPVPKTVVDWCLPIVVIVLSVLLAELILKVKGEQKRNRPPAG